MKSSSLDSLYLHCSTETKDLSCIAALVEIDCSFEIFGVHSAFDYLGDGVDYSLINAPSVALSCSACFSPIRYYGLSYEAGRMLTADSLMSYKWLSYGQNFNLAIGGSSCCSLVIHLLPLY